LNPIIIGREVRDPFFTENAYSVGEELTSRVATQKEAQVTTMKAQKKLTIVIKVGM